MPLSTTLAFLPHIGPLELTVILIVALLLFGRRLPEVGRSVGQAIIEFRKGLKGVQDDVTKAESEHPSMRDPAKASAAAGSTSSQSHTPALGAATTAHAAATPVGDPRRVSTNDHPEG